MPSLKEAILAAASVALVVYAPALGLGALGTAIVQVGGAVVLSAASKAMMPKQGRLGRQGGQAERAMRDRKVSIREPAAPRDLVYGTVRKGGVIVYINSSKDPSLGNGNNVLDLVVVLAGHSVQSIGAVYFDDKIALDANGVAQGPYASSILPKPRQIAKRTSPWTGNSTLNAQIIAAVAAEQAIFDAEYNDQFPLRSDAVTVAKRLGTPDQTSFTMLRAANQTTFTILPDWTAFSVEGSASWTSAHRLAGCAAIHLRMYYTPDRFPNGIPNISVDIVGKNDILDPRDNVRRFTTNAALCVADYMSLQDFSLGAQIGAADGIDSNSLIEAANICDETVNVPGGGTQARYTCNGTVTLAETPQTIIEMMLAAMAGSCVWLGGAWRIRAGAYRTPTVTLTDNDVRAGGLSLETRVSRTQNANAVRGTFISPANDSQVDDFPAYESAAYLAEDGGERRWLDLALPFTNTASMAQRLARIELERIRRQMTVTLGGKLSAWRVSAGGTVMLTYARWGLTAKPFEVQGLTLQLAGTDQPELVPDLVLRETSPLVYDFDAAEAAIYAAAPRTNLPSAFDIAPPSSLTVSESLYITRDGSGVKALARLDWLAPETGFGVEYIVSSRPDGGVFEQRGRTADLFFEILDIDPGNFEFSVKAVTILGVSSAPVTTDREIFGLAAPPVILTGANLQSAGGLAVLEWDQSTDLDVRQGGSIVIRHSTSSSPAWANSVSMKTVSGGMQLAVVPLKPGAYLLRARDASGVAGPVVILTTDGIQAVGFAAVTTLQEDDEFSGTKDGTAEVDAVLQLAALGNFDDAADVDAIANVDVMGKFGTSGTYSFAAGMDLGSLRRVRLRSVIASTIVSLGDNIDTRPGSVDTFVNFDGEDGGDVDAEVQVRTSQTDPAISPDWSGWVRVDSHEVSAWGVQARAILTSTDAEFSPAVENLRLVAEEVS